MTKGRAASQSAPNGPASRKLQIPRVARVALRGFTTYALNKNVELDIERGATCLAGANGLGKSTFLASMLFGITGSILEANGPQSRNLSEYKRDAVSYAREYFTGRIGERDRERAHVALHVELGDYLIKLERPVFRSKPELNFFSVSMQRGRPHTVITNSKDIPGEHRLAAYESFVTSQVGLETFEQFIFLNHYVLMFDESRHLLFWDRRHAEQALFLVFGGNQESIAVDKLRRTVEKEDSKARNLQYDASNLQQRIIDLQNAFGLDRVMPSDIVADVQMLLNRESSLASKFESTESAISDVVLRAADKSAALVALRDRYSREFQQLLSEQADPSSFPLIRSSLLEMRCGICGTAGGHVASHIEQRLASHHCPLCNSTIATGIKSASYDRLSSIDAEIAKAQEELSDATLARRRLDTERDELAKQLKTTQKALSDYEKLDRSLVASIRRREMRAGDDPDQISLQALRGDLEHLLMAKQIALKIRDEKKMELSQLQSRLGVRYSAAEKDFIPMFRKLAELFLGRPLTVRLKKAAGGMSLVVDLDQSERREPFQLSESQRFFIDLALRMSLVQFMSGDVRAPLYVDTPEGALDIAYERQVGEMFAEFVKSGHDIFMTANINSSQLLKELARKCGNERFHLVLMTAWSKLSEVQIAGESLFKDAILAIENAANGLR